MTVLTSGTCMRDVGHLWAKEAKGRDLFLFPFAFQGRTPTSMLEATYYRPREKREDRTLHPCELQCFVL